MYICHIQLCSDTHLNRLKDPLYPASASGHRLVPIAKVVSTRDSLLAKAQLCRVATCKGGVKGIDEPQLELPCSNEPLLEMLIWTVDDACSAQLRIFHLSVISPAASSTFS